MARTLGSILRKAREATGLSQTDVANTAGLTAGHLSRVERGEKGIPNFEIVARLADALGLSLDELAADCGFAARKTSQRALLPAALAAKLRRIAIALRTSESEIAAAASEIEAKR